jgi:DNA-binding MurR/RpiR family transcriptional regulator
MDSGTIQKVVDLLDAAPRIFATGEGSLMYLAEAFTARLLILGATAHPLSSELSGQLGLTVGVKPKDVFLGIGFTPIAISVAAMLRLARQAGAHTIGIVESPTNPIAGVAEHVILAPVGTAGIMPSWTAMVAVLHGLVQGLTLRRVDTATGWVMQTDRLLQEYVEELEKSIPSMREVMTGRRSG